MRREQVPQDDAGLFDGVHELTYAVDDDGRYVPIPSPGWDAANLANAQYWQLLDDEVTAVIDAVRAGRASPLAYWMALHQMDDAMVAAYVGLRKGKVRRHRRRAAAFARVDESLAARYAAVFRIGVAALRTLPEKPLLPTERRDAEVDERHHP